MAHLQARRALRNLAVAGLLLGGSRGAASQEASAGGDDRYRFLPTAGEERTLEHAPAGSGLGWTWTAPASAWDTALLGVRLSAGDVSPWVELRAGNVRLQQYLDRGARGLRFLNLTGLRAALAAGTAVALEGHGVTIDAGPARLRLFTNHLDRARPVLVLAPHPDDAEIAAFGLYSSSNASIVTVTSGNAGDANYAAEFPDPAEHYLFKGYMRAWGSVTVPWQGGVPPERCFNLGYFDARLKSMHARPDAVVAEMYGPNADVAPYRRANVSRLLPSTSRANTWRHLVEDLVQVLRKVEPAVVVMPHPFLDTHSDHQYVAIAAVEALERWQKPVTFLLYTNHAAHNLYPFGPAGSVTSLPPWAGAEIPVEGVYAHPVTPELQRRKLFALESMHDLRLSPSEQAACGDPRAARRPDYPRDPETDYFRRGPRPQEMFFVHGRDGVRALIRAFLEQETRE